MHQNVGLLDENQFNNKARDSIFISFVEKIIRHDAKSGNELTEQFCVNECQPSFMFVECDLDLGFDRSSFAPGISGITHKFDD